MKRIESLLNIASMKFEFQNLEIRFHKRQVSFLVVKTVKCKRSINYKIVQNIFENSNVLNSKMVTFHSKLFNFFFPKIV